MRLVHAAQAGPDDVLAADSYVFGAPEDLVAISGQLKHFFDRSYYPVLDRITGRPYACLIRAGSDGQNAVRQIERIANGWRLKPMAEPVIVCTRAQSPEAILVSKQKRGRSGTRPRVGRDDGNGVGAGRVLAASRTAKGGVWGGEGSTHCMKAPASC